MKVWVIFKMFFYINTSIFYYFISEINEANEVENAENYNFEVENEFVQGIEFENCSNCSII